ncbi:hypothetical protein FA15DRAFT_590311 [Coprinopsis marcescibilis]|uniref:Uncharacterized protein n=1 Tax=Coprinopsis marcescibilis TaxID=230819 RepID=A0A5C3KXY2_COPMA|nr:hypothetical protein FA15DRAFT_590311 [Coprinopsis marcescibilis]
MAMKRKLDFDVDDVVPLKQKQMKLVPFPNFEFEDDVAMLDAEPIYPQQHHLRLPSNASCASSGASDSPLSHSPLYPTYDLSPATFFNPDTGTVDANSHSFSHYSQSSPSQSALGLMQPSPNSFVHHG